MLCGEHELCSSSTFKSGSNVDLNRIIIDLNNPYCN